jgi:hypothetical protein
MTAQSLGPAKVGPGTQFEFKRCIQRLLASRLRENDLIFSNFERAFPIL